MSFSTPKTFVEGTSAKASDVNENFDAVEQVINELMDAVMPVGSVITTARPSAPTGYLLCEGQSVSRTKYAALFGAIGVTYGKGDGSTTFNLPDLRGRVPVGADAGAGRLSANGARGNAGGAERVTLNQNEIPSHQHGLSNVTLGEHHHNIPMFESTRHEGNLNAYQAMNAGGNTTTSGTAWDDGSHPLHQLTDGPSTPTGGSHSNMQPFQVLSYAIKY